MRRINYILLIAFCLITSHSCDHPVKLKMKSFVGSYVNYETISVSQFDMQCLVLSTDESFTSIYQFSKDKTIKQRYSELSKKYNDISYNKTVIGIAPEVSRVITPDITDIRVTSINTFNSLHPDNSSLDDVVRFMSLTLHPYISSFYTHAYRFEGESRSNPFDKYCKQYFYHSWDYPEFGYSSILTPCFPLDFRSFR